MMPRSSTWADCAGFRTAGGPPTPRPRAIGAQCRRVAARRSPDSSEEEHRSGGRDDLGITPGMSDHAARCDRVAERDGPATATALRAQRQDAAVTARRRGGPVRTPCRRSRRTRPRDRVRRGSRHDCRMAVHAHDGAHAHDRHNGPCQQSPHVAPPRRTFRHERCRGSVRGARGAGRRQRVECEGEPAAEGRPAGCQRRNGTATS